MRTYPIGGGLGNTLGDNLGITLFMTGISTIFTLVSLSSKEELLTQSTHDGLVELSLDKLVTVHLVDIALTLSNGTLSTKSFVWTSTSSCRVLDYRVSGDDVKEEVDVPKSRRKEMAPAGSTDHHPSIPSWALLS